MDEPAHQVIFSGSVPDVYDRLMVPMLFDVYAEGLVERVDALDATQVLEVAAGTGAATRVLASALPHTVTIVASDVSPAMIQHATTVGTVRPVDWQVADVMDLPFPDASFDRVVCQFGAMFFPDRVTAYREIRRVLRPGGVFAFNVWDRIENNDFARVVAAAIAESFPTAPSAFMARVPHGYHDPDLIRAELTEAGFDRPIEIDEVGARSRAATNNDVATAFCCGTPMRHFFEALGEDQLRAATEIAAGALAREFGRVDLDGRINAFVIKATMA